MTLVHNLRRVPLSVSAVTHEKSIKTRIMTFFTFSFFLNFTVLLSDGTTVPDILTPPGTYRVQVELHTKLHVCTGHTRWAPASPSPATPPTWGTWCCSGDRCPCTHHSYQGSRKSLAVLALLADKLKSHGQILTKITYILSRLCMENVGKGI